MQATIVLMNEHRLIERVLTAMEVAIRQMERDEPVSAAFFLKAVEFIQGFADGCHHKKEEGALFPAMVSSGLPRQSGPIAVMLAEHEQGRRLTRAMRSAAERWERGEEPARGEVVVSAKEYVWLLRAHITKEDGVLFPMADEVIVSSERTQFEEAFGRIEEEAAGGGLHEKYLALAGELEGMVR